MTSVNNIETEYSDISRKMEWPTLFQTIRTKSSDNKYTFAEAAKPQNQEFNRYRDVNPYDHSRIVLKKGPTDYVNANLVKVEKANRQYILTQGPTIKTVSHFWLMVWEQKTAAIIMLNKLIEKKQEKCSQYWPGKIGTEHILKLDDVGLQVEYISHSDYQHYLTRQFKLTELSSSESRTIVQYHYTTWPDFGVPGSPTVFLEFLRRVRAQGVLDDTVGPAIVHCSAGIGRSGTFCLVDSVLVLIEKDGQNSVDVKEILLEMRKYRMGLIQTHEQLRFSYQAIIEGAKNLSCPDKDNCNLLPPISTTTSDPSIRSINNGVLSTGNKMEDEDDDDEPPPLPPPRADSLAHPQLIPVRLTVNNSKPGVIEEEEDEIFSKCPVGPLPQAPPMEEEGSSEDELEDSSSDGDDLLEAIEWGAADGRHPHHLQDDDDDDNDDEEDDVYDDMVESNSVLSNETRGESGKSKDSKDVHNISAAGVGSDQNENERTTSPTTTTDDPNNPTSPTTQSPTSPAAEQRQRHRQERQQKIAAQVREMKRRQRSNERQQNNGGVWRQLKRPKTSLPD